MKSKLLGKTAYEGEGRILVFNQSTVPVFQKLSSATFAQAVIPCSVVPPPLPTTICPRGLLTQSGPFPGLFDQEPRVALVTEVVRDEADRVELLTEWSCPSRRPVVRDGRIKQVVEGMAGDQACQGSRAWLHLVLSLTSTRQPSVLMY